MKSVFFFFFFLPWSDTYFFISVFVKILEVLRFFRSIWSKAALRSRRGRKSYFCSFIFLLYLFYISKYKSLTILIIKGVFLTPFRILYVKPWILMFFFNITLSYRTKNSSVILTAKSSMLIDHGVKWQFNALIPIPICSWTRQKNKCINRLLLLECLVH